MDWFSFKYPQKHYKEATLIVYILQKKKLRHRAVTWHTKLKTATSAKPVLKKKKEKKRISYYINLLPHFYYNS